MAGAGPNAQEEREERERHLDEEEEDTPGSGCLRMGVLGAGAVGAYVGGCLGHGNRDVRVLLVGRDRLVEWRESRGGYLWLKAPTGSVFCAPRSRVGACTDPKMLDGCDAVLVACKSHALPAAARDLAALRAKPRLVVVMMNGVGNAARLRALMGTAADGLEIADCVVNFNVVWSSDAFVRTTGRKPGPDSFCLAVQNTPGAAGLLRRLRKTGLVIKATDDILSAQYGKLLVNMTNAVNALSGVPLVRVFSDAGYRLVLRECIAEAEQVMRKAGIRPGAPYTRLFGLLLRLPDFVYRWLFPIIVKLDPSAKCSMLQDLEASKPTEIDALNGEVVRLADAHGCPAPISRKLVELVKEAERLGLGAPSVSSERLVRELGLA